MNPRKNNGLGGVCVFLFWFFDKCLELGWWQSGPARHVGAGKPGLRDNTRFSKPGTRTQVTGHASTRPLALTEITHHIKVRQQEKQEEDD